MILVPLAQQENIETGRVIFKASGVESGSGSGRDVTVLYRILSLLFDQLDLLTRESQRLGFSDESRRPIVAAFDRLSIHGLVMQWKQLKPLFEQTLPPLHIFGEGLPDEGPAISDEELAELKKSIAALRDDVENSDLPVFVKEFVYEQLNIIRHAIEEYPLTGVVAFRKAARDAVFHEVEQDNVVKDFRDEPLMTRWKSMQSKVLQLSKPVVEFSKLLAASDSITEHGVKAVHAIEAVANHLKHLK